jgi:DNA-binding SARP family transcriptional activator
MARLTLLGPPTVTLPEPAAPPTLGAKDLALLTFLVLEPGPHTREELAGLLWGESSEVEARTSLRQALQHLRTKLGPLVQGDRAVVQLVGQVECDILEFRRMVAQEPRRALTMDIPRFLAGFLVRRAPQFEEWVTETRRELVGQYHNTLGTLAREAMGQWRWRDAAELARRWTASDPFSDEAIRLATEALYLGGDRGAALALYTEYRVWLLAETGCEPSRSLLNLIRRVESDAASINSRPITDEWYARAPSFESSLIGREHEWNALLGTWKTVKRRNSRIVLIEGEPGVGKSRLSEEFTRWVVADGGSVLRSHAYDARAGLPYEPVVEILRDALATPGLAGTAPEWLTEVARLLPELRGRFPGLPEPAPVEDSSALWRLFEGVAQLLLALAAERPVVVSLDDLQWCDGDSCDLLRFLIRRSEKAPVLWLGTLSLGAMERDAPSARLCRVLRAKSHASVLSLRPLTEEELWAAIRQMGHLSTPTGARRFANRMFEVTAGNPFYLIELLKTLFAQGLLAIDEETGEWTVAPGLARDEGRAFPISQSVHDVIAERVERLPGELRDLLITMAVAGAGCQAEVLSHVHGISRLHAASVGDALADRRLVVEDSGMYRCAHTVIAHVVRNSLTASRAKEVHRRLALALERSILAADLHDGAREIARHADRGGEPALAYRYALLAADRARQRYAFAEAMSWLDLAASNASGPEEADAANRLTANVLEVAGWSEAPPPTAVGGPITRELTAEDLDLPVRR